MKEAWWKYRAPKIEMPWWKLVVIFLVILIVLVFRVAYRDLVYKKQMPIENTKVNWQSVGPITLVFGGQSYTGDFYFDKMSLEKKEGNITLWVKVTTHTPVVQHKGNETYSWNDQIVRWVINCETKEVKVDYLLLFLNGRKQYGGKLDEVNLPLVRGTTTYAIYEMFCF